MNRARVVQGLGEGSKKRVKWVRRLTQIGHGTPSEKGKSRAGDGEMG